MERNKLKTPMKKNAVPQLIEAVKAILILLSA